MAKRSKYLHALDVQISEALTRRDKLDAERRAVDQTVFALQAARTAMEKATVRRKGKVAPIAANSTAAPLTSRGTTTGALLDSP